MYLVSLVLFIIYVDLHFHLSSFPFSLKSFLKKYFIYCRYASNKFTQLILIRVFYFILSFEGYFCKISNSRLTVF